MTRRADVAPREAAELLRCGDLRLIDVRTPQEWAEGHAPGAEHCPLDDLDPADIATDRPLLLICRSGRRSGLAADRLAATHDVTNISGGLQAWSDDDLPVTSPTTPG
jgi:rhodanese-related sulfurtransferase